MINFNKPKREDGERDGKTRYFSEILEKISARAEKEGNVKADLVLLRKDLKKNGITLEEIGTTTAGLKKIEAKGNIVRAKEWYDLILDMIRESDTGEMPSDEALMVFDFAEKAADLLEKKVEDVLREDIGIGKEEMERILAIEGKNT